MFSKIKSLFCSKSNEPSADMDRTQLLINHIESVFGKIAVPYETEVNDQGDTIQIFLCEPSKKNPHYSVVTCGAGFLAREDDDELDLPVMHEFFMNMPPKWELPSPEVLNDENSEDVNHFLLGLAFHAMTIFAIYPNHLNEGHSIPCSDVFDYSDEMVRFFFDAHIPINADLMLHYPDDDYYFTSFLAATPVSQAELDYRKENSTDALIDLLYKNNAHHTFYLSRDSLV